MIDGNNLLYVREDIRTITLKKGMGQGTQALSEFFSKANLSLKKIMSVVYDYGDNSKVFENLKIDIARPAFNTSDDWLADRTFAMPADIKSKTLFVTSDRGLQERLTTNGCAHILSSKRFLDFCDKAIKQ